MRGWGLGLPIRKGVSSLFEDSLSWGLGVGFRIFVFMVEV